MEVPFKEQSMYGLSAKQLAFVERWQLVEVFLFFFKKDETMTKVSIGEEDAKLWLLLLSFRLVGESAF